jgi:AhpD family alkylhydroperoxidase
MKLEHKTLRLIAVGAALAANCQPCLEVNVKKACEAGADGQEIADAIEVGKMVRSGAATKMDAFAASLDLSKSPSGTDISVGCCEAASAPLGGQSG